MELYEYRFRAWCGKWLKIAGLPKREQLTRRYRTLAAAPSSLLERYIHHTRSRKRAYRVLEETGLPKWVLKNAIQTAYGIAGWKLSLLE